MTVYDEKLNEMLSFYENLNDLFKLELESCPKGKLIYQDNCGNNQFMQLINENGIRSRRGINRNKDLIKRLSQERNSIQGHQKS